MERELIIMDKVIPEVGMGATELMYTDRHPYTIIEVSENKKTIKVQRDFPNLLPNKDGEIIEVTLRKSGAWIAKGQAIKGGRKFDIGYRKEYIDPSF